MANKYWDSTGITELLRNRYCPPAWAFIPQVRNGTGFVGQARTADALAMSLWPSRGLGLHGFEIKVMRSDWIKELRSPEKAEEIAQYCDFWWIVAPEEIIKIDEVPENWGLMVPKGNNLKILKEAVKLKAHEPDKLFLAAILRRAQEEVTPEAKIKEAYNAGREKGKADQKSMNRYETERYQNLQKALFDFEKSAGIKIGEWEGNKETGEAVRMVLRGDHLKTKNQLNNLLETARNIVKFIDESLQNDKNERIK